MNKWGSNALSATIWKITYAKTLAKYTYYIDKFWEISISTILYLEKINSIKYYYI